MLLELHINIPGCNEVSYWTRSGLIVWLNNLKMLLKVCISLQLFRTSVLLWGTPSIKPTEVFFGSCSFHHLFRHAVIILNKKQRGYKVFTSGFSPFFSCFSPFPSQLETGHVSVVVARSLPCLSHPCGKAPGLHHNQLCAAFELLIFCSASN